MNKKIANWWGVVPTNLRAIVLVGFLIFVPIFFCISFLFIVSMGEHVFRDTEEVSSVQGENVVAAEEPVQNVDNEVIEDQVEEKEEPQKFYKVTKITDGDTIKIDLEEEEVSVRLLGIDSPESNHPSIPVECFAKEAKDKLKRLLDGNEIRFEYDTEQGDKDRYGRHLMHIWIRKGDSDLFVNKHMVENGYAEAYREQPSTYLDELIEAEKFARENKKGLWGDVCKCADKAGEEASRGCISCNKQEIKYYEWDCSLTKKYFTNSKCAFMCPQPEPTPAPVTSPTYVCNCSKTCTQITTCSEARYQLNVCGCGARDGDNDGIPCENLCW